MEILKNRMEMMFLVEAEMCNPNGDPDADNEPRRDPDGYGIISDVMPKRAIRNYLQDVYGDLPGCEVMLTKGTSVNRKIAEAVFAVNDIDNAKNLGKNGNLKVVESTVWLARRYIDVRLFGGVLSTGLNAGQVKGVIQFGISRSKDPVEIQMLTNTRDCYSEGKGLNTLAEYEEEERTHPHDKKRTMGTKYVVVYGLYEVRISLSAAEAEKVGCTEEDLEKFEEAVLQMFDYNNSSSKMGMHIVTPLIIFKHVGTQKDTNSVQGLREAKLGCAPAHKLYGLLSAKKKDGVENPRKLADYDIQFDMKHVPNGVQVGMKYLPFEPVKWGKDALKDWEYDVIK